MRLSQSSIVNSSMPHSPKRILIVAGEASADRYGARLVKRLQSLHGPGNLEFYGTGGDEMRMAGVQLFCHVRELAHIGVREALSSLRIYYKTYRRLTQESAQRPPVLAILLDFPDFNLRLAKNETPGHQGYLLHKSAGLGMAERPRADHPGVCGQDAGHPPF